MADSPAEIVRKHGSEQQKKESDETRLIAFLLFASYTEACPAK